MENASEGRGTDPGDRSAARRESPARVKRENGRTLDGEPLSSKPHRKKTRSRITHCEPAQVPLYPPGKLAQGWAPLPFSFLRLGLVREFGIGNGHHLDSTG